MVIFGLKMFQLLNPHVIDSDEHNLAQVDVSVIADAEAAIADSLLCLKQFS